MLRSSTIDIMDCMRSGDLTTPPGSRILDAVAYWHTIDKGFRNVTICPQMGRTDRVLLKNHLLEPLSTGDGLSKPPPLSWTDDGRTKESP